VNEKIRVREVRVIGADGEQLGVMAPEDALEQAREVGLDLVEVAATSRPPVCRIMDYGRYKYEQQKKKKSGKQSHAAALKEVKLRPGTDLHDLEFKLNNARRFLMDGDKVKITVMFRGREMVHTYRGREQLKQVQEQLKDIAKMENPPRMEGRFMSMILVGDREAVAEARRLEGENEPVEETPEKAKTRKAERSERAHQKALEEVSDEEAVEEVETEGEAGEVAEEAASTPEA